MANCANYTQFGPLFKPLTAINIMLYLVTKMTGVSSVLKTLPPTHPCYNFEVQS